jgi:hypothetical protein
LRCFGVRIRCDAVGVDDRFAIAGEITIRDAVSERV